MKNKIVVVGSSNTDMVIRVNHIPQPGETIIGHDFMTNQGGKGANQAVAAVAMNGEVVFVACLGNDGFGRQSKTMMKERGIDIRFVRLIPDVPTGCAMIAVDDKGENSIVVSSGANAMLSSEDIDEAMDVIEKEAAVLLMQLESPIDTLTYAAAKAHAAGAIVVLNPAPFPSKPLPKDLLKNVDIVVPNETETAGMTGLLVESEGDMVYAIEAIQAKGIKHVIITAGGDGSYTLVDGKLHHQPALKVRTVDTTAAGDTYCGVLCVALRDGLSLKEAMKMASVAASLCTTREGAWSSVPTREEVLEKMKELEVS